MSASGDDADEGTLLGQGFIVALLVGAMMLLYPFAPPSVDGDVAATAMLALGFVVLASFTVGHLAETVGLPHITGYLVAGVLLGPSFAHLLPPGARIPPFDEGVLEPAVVDQLGLLDTLAVALIALTAGGELRIDTLRKGLGAILGVLGGQIVAISVLVGGFVVVVSGAAVPEIVLPGLEGVDATVAAIALGLVVAAISVATSPAATIAVINGAEASGPMTRLVLSTVVLKDVIVVVAFSLASVFASQVLGTGASLEGGLGVFLTVHIGGSLLAGAAIGSATALYLRFVDREVLLFLVAMVYVASFLAGRLHLDPVLLFIAAGFTAANFSRQGENLVHNVEKLSGPVYVVFFTLAGARLHLDEVAAVAPFALALVGIRAAALAAGSAFGAHVGGADPATRRVGWMGFVSQAGVALSLASLVGDTFGPAGASLQTLLIAGVALNELLGPVLLKVGLGLANEIPTRAKRSTAAAPEDSVPGVDPAELTRAPGTGRATYRTPALDGAVAGLGERLAALAAQVRRDAVAPRRRRAVLLLGEVRRDILRLHRRAVVAARKGRLDEEVLLREERDLFRRVRDDLVATADDVRRLAAPALAPLLDGLDDAVDACPTRIEARFEPVAPAPWWRRALARVFGGGEPTRSLPVHELARYHLWGRTVAALPDVQTRLLRGMEAAVAPIDDALERSMAAYRRALPDAPDAPGAAGDDEDDEDTAAPDAAEPSPVGTTAGEDVAEPAAAVPASGPELRRRMARSRAVVEAALDQAASAVGMVYDEVERRLGDVLEEGLQAVEGDLLILGTRWLPPNRRRSSLVFRARSEGIRRLETTPADDAARAAARLDGLALDLDLRAFALAVSAAVEEHVPRLSQDIRGRTQTQLERLAQALDDIRPELEELWQGSGTTIAEAGAADRLRSLAEPVLDVMAQAEARAEELRDLFAGDSDEALRPLVAAVESAAEALGERYERAVGPDPQDPLVGIPLRQRVSAELSGAVSEDLAGVLGTLAAELSPMLEALRESRRLSVLNVDLAAGELELADEGDPLDRELLRQLVEPGLGRATETTRSHLEASQHLAARGARELRGVLDGFVARQREELAGERVAANAVGSLRGSQPAPDRDSRRPPDRRRWAQGALRGTLRRAAAWLLGETRRDGEGVHGDVGGGLDDLRLRPVPRVAELPVAYRRLFEGEALEAGEVALPRDVDAGELARRLARRQGRLRTLALVGAPGVGKVAALRAIARSRTFGDVIRVVLEGPTHPEDLDDLVARDVRGKLVTLRGIEWLARPGAGGLSGIDALVRRILEDEGANAWVLAIDTLPWRQMAALSPLGDAFPEVVRFGPLDPPRLRRALLGRHALSGYELAFHGPSDGDPRAAEADGDHRREDRYFDAVFRSSGGRVRDALGEWLGSVRRLDDQGTVHLGPPSPTLEAAIGGLDDEHFLELFAIARWGWLDAEGLAESVRTDVLRATARLERLVHLGLVDRIGANGRPCYRVARHLRGWVTTDAAHRGWVAGEETAR